MTVGIASPKNSKKIEKSENMENKNSFGSGLFDSKKEKVIATDELQIRGHLLRWKDVVIQISNISQISVGSYPTQPFPMWTLVAILIGLFSIQFNILIGLAGLLLGGGVIFMWYQERESKKGYKFLHLRLNSGTVFSFVFEREDFLRKVLDVFANIFEDVEKNVNNSITIDIKNCEVSGNGSVIDTLNAGMR